MAGKRIRVGAAAEETGALIGTDGGDSRFITISQQFTCLHLWQLRGGEDVFRGGDYMFKSIVLYSSECKRCTISLVPPTFLYISSF